MGGFVGGWISIKDFICFLKNTFNSINIMA